MRGGASTDTAVAGVRGAQHDLDSEPDGPKQQDVGQFRASSGPGTLGDVGDSNAMRLAYRLSATAIILMVLAAAVGATVSGFYPEILGRQRRCAVVMW